MAIIKTIFITAAVMAVAGNMLPCCAESGDDMETLSDKIVLADDTVIDLVNNGSMEGANAEDNIPYYWFARTGDQYTSTVQITNERMALGAYSMKVSGRTSPQAGAGNYFTQPQKGEQYIITAYIYATETDVFHCSALSGYWKDVNCNAVGECEAGKWSKLSAVVTVPEDWIDGSLQIWSENSSADFYVDAVSMTLYDPDNVPETNITVNTPYLRGEEAVVRVRNTTDQTAHVNVYTARYSEGGALEVLNMSTADITGGAVDEICVPAEKGDTVYVWDEERRPYIKPTEVDEITPEEYMDMFEPELTLKEAIGVTDEVDSVEYGTIKKYQYYSRTAERDTNVNVLLPAGYSEDKEYPVLYMLHGYWGNEDSLTDAGDPSLRLDRILGNLIASGEAEEMIVVFPYIFCSKDKPYCTAMDPENTLCYDNFINDLVTDLMPFIESNFSVKTGRENTAITGFSQGGREALFIGFTRSDLFGYVGGVCPAPGLTPGADLSAHPGQIQEDEFVIDPEKGEPYMIMLSGAVVDTVVGNQPELYHNILNTNGVKHIWQHIPDGDHGGNGIRPHFYNYVKTLFKAK